MDSLAPKLRLREQFRSVMRLNHYSIRTEKSYWYWIRYFIRFHGMRHPLELGTSDVNAFLSWLATDRQVAAATQNLALNAIVFLYARVLEQPLGEIGDVVRVKRPPRLPTVLTHQEAMSIIEHLGQPYRLLASLMYGAGLRVVESSRLRVKDIDFRNQTIIVRDGKGCKDRTTLLPAPLIIPIKHRIAQIELHGALRRKCTRFLCLSLSRCDVNIHALLFRWLGSGFSLQAGSVLTKMVGAFAIMCMSAPFSGPSNRQCAVRASKSLSDAIRSGTPLPPSCYAEVVIFVRYKPCWAMRMSVLRRFTLMCLVRALLVCRAHWVDHFRSSGTLPPYLAHSGICGNYSGGN